MTLEVLLRGNWEGQGLPGSTFAMQSGQQVVFAGFLICIFSSSQGHHDVLAGLRMDIESPIAVPHPLRTSLQLNLVGMCAVSQEADTKQSKLDDVDVPHTDLRQAGLNVAVSVEGEEILAAIIIQVVEAHDPFAFHDPAHLRHRDLFDCCCICSCSSGSHFASPIVSIGTRD